MTRDLVWLLANTESPHVWLGLKLTTVNGNYNVHVR